MLDLTETGTDTLGFCDVFDVVGVVPLETTDECLLGYVSKVEVVDGNRKNKFRALAGAFRSSLFT